ncbi:MAG: permease [Pseudomonadota bacterium]
MTDLPIPALPRIDRVWLAIVLLFAGIALIDLAQAGASAAFTLRALIETAPWLILSIALAAYAAASDADNMIARAFTGAPVAMIALAALMGGLSPFCSCGVIPLIAALLAMGVPLSAVMAFWLASPVIDPAMFALTSGVLGVEFAIAKTVTAVGLGLFGGFVTLSLERGGALTAPLRDVIGDGGCGGAKVRAPKPVTWGIWAEPDRRAKFARTAGTTTLFLAKWLALAFALESLMIAWLPADAFATLLGGDGVGTIALATIVGVPAYLNGFAALPLVSGLMETGLGQGAALAFLVAGGVSSLPAAMAVWALARPPVVVLYLALALSGSFLAGLAFQVLS